MTPIDRTFFAFAVLILLLPFLGFPRAWEEWALGIIAVVMIVAILWRTWRIHRVRFEEASSVRPVSEEVPQSELSEQTFSKEDQRVPFEQHEGDVSKETKTQDPLM